MSADDLAAAKSLAAANREVAARLPLDSELRGLALRSAGHWARLAGIPRGLLTGSD